MRSQSTYITTRCCMLFRLVYKTQVTTSSCIWGRSYERRSKNYGNCKESRTGEEGCTGQESRTGEEGCTGQESRCASEEGCCKEKVSLSLPLHKTGVLCVRTWGWATIPFLFVRNIFYTN